MDVGSVCLKSGLKHATNEQQKYIDSQLPLNQLYKELQWDLSFLTIYQILVSSDHLIISRAYVNFV